MENDQNVINNAFQTKCSQCGGAVTYSPEAENLKCPYCGAVTEVDKTPVTPTENDFNQWKDKAREAPEQSSETAVSTQIKCRGCGANTIFDPNTSGAKCAFCGTPLVMEEAQVNRFWKPEYLLPFKVGEQQCTQNFNKWLSGKFFLPNNIKKAGTNHKKFKGVYLPYWTYDANTSTVYTGERGVHRTITEKDQNGKPVTRTVTDWYPAAGKVDLVFDDVMIPATDTVPGNLLGGLKAWDMENVVPYKKEFLAGFITELYKEDFVQAYPKAQDWMEERIMEAVREDIGGSEQRIISHSSRFDDLKFKHLLLPIWISAFQYNGKTYQFIVNGRTGAVSGQYPKSALKIALVVLAVIAVIVALYSLF